MALRNMMARMGAGAASVDTQLDSPRSEPGGTVSGRVHLVGGKVAQEVREIRLSLQTTVEVETRDSEYKQDVTFAEQVVAGSAFTVAPGEVRDLPFSMVLPYQCPITRIGSWTPRGVKVGVRTAVDIPGAVDPKDLDPVEVHPLPVQQALLSALDQLGFRFTAADVEKGRLPGSDLPFYQELEFGPAPAYRRSINELEVTFLAHAGGVEVVLEADRRGGLLSEGRDAAGRLQLRHTDTDVGALAQQLDATVRQLGARRGWL